MDDILTEMFGNIRDAAQLVVKGAESYDGDRVRYGQVTAVTRPTSLSGQKVSVLMGGVTLSNVPCINSYFPAINDAVVMLQSPGGRLLCVGCTNRADGVWMAGPTIVVKQVTNPGFTVTTNRYKYDKQDVVFKWHITGNGTPAGTAGTALEVSLPVNPVPGSVPVDVIGAALIYDPGGATFRHNTIVETGATTGYMMFGDTSGPGAAFNQSWTTNWQCRGEVRYTWVA